MDCDICSILATKNDNADVLLMETTKWRVVLDQNQRFLGKAFVTLLDHKSELSDLDENDWQEFQQIVQKIERAVRMTFGPNHFNWSCLMNIAAMNAQPTHVHWHVHPRYNKAVKVADELFEDTQFYPRAEKVDHVVDREILDKIATLLRNQL